MPEIRYLDDDIVHLYEYGKPRKEENLLAVMFWGDPVKIIREEAGQYVVELPRERWDREKAHYVTEIHTASLPRKARFRSRPLLMLRILDVGQGDAAILQTPKGRIVMIDGGEEANLHRYVWAAFDETLATKPLHLDAIVVTHGDADHFAGLTKLISSYRKGGSLMVTADRVLHNGLVKGAADTAEGTFGKTVKESKTLYAVELADDLLQVPDSRMNSGFQAWKKALGALKQASPGLTIHRIQYGDDGVFGFLEDEGIRTKVLGPIVEQVGGEPGLPFLAGEDGTGRSASATINGHSVVLHITYDNVRFLLGADLNKASEERLLDKVNADGVSLAAEVLKVPHHGSADFSPTVLAAIQPVVSVISSGDESTAKEYIHPRAGLVGALGKASRDGVEKPLVYVTEMVAFFESVGLVRAPAMIKSHGKTEAVEDDIPNAYRKKAFGIVHIRTDGQRILVATHSGKPGMKESYAFSVDGSGKVKFEKKTRTI